MTNAKKKGSALLLFAVVAAVGAILIGAVATTSSSTSAAANSQGSSAPLPYTQKDPGNCVAGFNVKFDPNVNYDDRTGGIDVQNPPVGRNQILDLAKHDPRYLFKLVETSPLGKDRFPQLKNYLQLMGVKGTPDDGCYTALGRDAFDTYQGVLYSPSTKIVSAPAQGYGQNSGTNPHGGPFMEPPAQLTGDPSALKITYGNGQVVYILHRCGNVFVPGNQAPPNIPVKQPPQVPPQTQTVPANTPPNTPPNSPPTTCSLTAPPGYVVTPQCTLSKPPQSWDCQQNAGPGCPPNPAHQPVQSNDPSLTAQPVTVPSNPPNPNPTVPVNVGNPAPPTPGGYNGGSTSNPVVSGPPIPVDTGTHTAPIGTCPFGC